LFLKKKNFFRSPCRAHQLGSIVIALNVQFELASSVSVSARLASSSKRSARSIVSARSWFEGYRSATSRQRAAWRRNSAAFSFELLIGISPVTLATAVAEHVDIRRTSWLYTRSGKTVDFPDVTPALFIAPHRSLIYPCTASCSAGGLGPNLLVGDQHLQYTRASGHLIRFQSCH